MSEYRPNSYAIWISNYHKSIGPVYAVIRDVFECDLSWEEDLKPLVGQKISIIDPNGAVLIALATLSQIRWVRENPTRLSIDIDRS